MAYIPKSKVKIQNTVGGELVYKMTDRDYIGDFIETSNGKFYAGTDTSNFSTELVKAVIPTGVEFGHSPDVVRYKKLLKKHFNILKITKTIIGSRPKPQEEDYIRGWFVRYFVKRHNSDFDYMEINEEDFNSILNQDGKYDHRLYKVGNMQWTLKGNVEGINNTNLKRHLKNFPLLNNLFSMLNEYQKGADLKKETITNQMAKSGELVYRDDPTKEYVGPYHIHPILGPMEGAEHTPEPHQRLLFHNEGKYSSKKPKTFVYQYSTEGAPKPSKTPTQGSGY